MNDVLAAAGKDGASQGVLGGLANELAGLVKLGVIIDVDGHDRAEDLLNHGLGKRVGGEHDGGLDKVADRVVVLATGKDLALGVRGGKVNVRLDLVERELVDDRTHEVLELVDGTLGDLGVLGDDGLLEVLGEALGHVHTRGGRALLTLVLESTTDGLQSSVVDGGGIVVLIKKYSRSAPCSPNRYQNMSTYRMDHVEVLATSLTNNTGVADVVVDVVTNLLPQVAEDVGGTSEVERREVGAGERDARDLLGITGDELDDTSGETGLLEELVDEVVGEHSRGRGLPDNDVAHQSGGTRKVTSNSSEVEGSHGVDETLETTELNAVPHALGVLGGLLLVDLLGVLAVEAEEIAELGSGINLGLPDVLALAEHGSGHHLVAVLGREEIGRLEEDSDTVVEGNGLPLGTGSDGTVNGLLGQSGIGLVEVGHHDLVLRGVELLSNVAGVNLGRKKNLRVSDPCS